MLGHTGVGKTTYVASLYGIMQQRIEDFILRSVDYKQHNQLMKMFEEISFGKYPSPTHQRSEYLFDIHYYFNSQDHKLMSFTFTDYRGGTIHESPNTEEVQVLIQDLSQANGIIMFFDAEAIVRGEIWNSKIGRMTSLVTHAIQNLNHPISLAIVLTKSDLVENFDQRIINPFTGIISVVEASKSISGCLIPISCSNQLINVQIPLLFCLKTLMTLYVQAKTSKELSNPKTIDKEQTHEAINHAIKNINSYVQQLPLIQTGTNLNTYIKKLSELKHNTNLNYPQKNCSIFPIYSDPFDAFNS